MWILTNKQAGDYCSPEEGGSLLGKTREYPSHLPKGLSEFPDTLAPGVIGLPGVDEETKKKG